VDINSSRKELTLSSILSFSFDEIFKEKICVYPKKIRVDLWIQIPPL